ncbi:hypothetical protein SB2_06915 [Methylobacterium radiotolerans]|nr:hypothetical protein SB3_08960 [Methylobacterium radiotolerans]KTS49275.1 hypothetical protein SB2_06915 [Methylobacterium radiotolerans]
MPKERVKIFRSVGATAADNLDRSINEWLGADANIGYEIVRTETSVTAVGDPMHADLIIVVSIWYVDEGGSDTKRSRARIMEA